jgi:hypothetical protein
MMWKAVHWLVLLPTLCFLPSLLCQMWLRLAVPSRDLVNWSAALFLGAFALLAGLLAGLCIARDRQLTGSRFLNLVSAGVLLAALPVAAAAVVGGLVSAFSPELVTYLGDDPTGMPSIACLLAAHAALAASLAIHTLRGGTAGKPVPRRTA